MTKRSRIIIISDAAATPGIETVTVGSTMQTFRCDLYDGLLVIDETL